MKPLATRAALSALVLSLATLTTGCVTWVKVTPEGEKIAVANRANVHNCTKVASVTVQGRDTYVGTMKRNPDTVSQELTSLARNQAATTSGNTIVAAGAIHNSSQDFDVFDCPTL